MELYFYISTAALAILLFFPVSRMIWILSVRHKMKRADRELTQSELEGEKARARFIGILLVTLFAFLFNLQIFSGSHG